MIQRSLVPLDTEWHSQWIIDMLRHRANPIIKEDDIIDLRLKSSTDAQSNWHPAVKSGSYMLFRPYTYRFGVIIDYNRLNWWWRCWSISIDWSKQIARYYRVTDAILEECRWVISNHNNRSWSVVARVNRNSATASFRTSYLLRWPLGY